MIACTWRARFPKRTEWILPSLVTDEEQFGQEVKIVLASAEFSKELTTSVMWLNDFGLDIRCVRMHPLYFNHVVQGLLCA